MPAADYGVRLVDASRRSNLPVVLCGLSQLVLAESAELRPVKDRLARSEFCSDPVARRPFLVLSHESTVPLPRTEAIADQTRSVRWRFDKRGGIEAASSTAGGLAAPRACADRSRRRRANWRFRRLCSQVDGSQWCRSARGVDERAGLFER